MSETTKLNDLQKLGVSYYALIIQMHFISMTCGSVFGMKTAQNHLALVESILGKEITDKLNNSAERDAILEQAEEFKNLMIPENLGLDDLFGNDYSS